MRSDQVTVAVLGATDGRWQTTPHMNRNRSLSAGEAWLGPNHEGLRPKSQRDPSMRYDGQVALDRLRLSAAARRPFSADTGRMSD